jgi:hypothetical protein
MPPQLNSFFKNFHRISLFLPWKIGISSQTSNGNHAPETEAPQEAEHGASILPFLVFRDKICVPVTRMEENNLLLLHPRDNSLVLRFTLGQEESHGFYLAPKLSNPTLFETKATQTYQQALRDPLLRTLPYVLETYRILEHCYRQPAYRIMEPAGHPDEGYLLKFYCKEAFGQISGQITCRVMFFKARVLFSSPVMTELKAALRQLLTLKSTTAS